MARYRTIATYDELNGTIILDYYSHTETDENAWKCVVEYSKLSEEEWEQCTDVLSSKWFPVEVEM